MQYLDSHGLDTLWDKIKSTFQPLDADLTSIAGLTGTSGLLKKTAANTWTLDTTTYVPSSSVGANSGVASLDSSGKVPLSQISDAVLGQLVYGGTVNASGVATLSTNAKTKLGVTSATVTLTNNTSTYGYTKCEGLYFIMSADSTFASLDLKVGDWLIATAAGWKKIDNTDAVTGVKGDNETNYRIGNVNITKANIGLGNVENTALSSWAGTTNITTLGTITSGTWHGTAIADSYISSAANWNGSNDTSTGSGYVSAVSRSNGVMSVTKTAFTKPTITFSEATANQPKVSIKTDGGDATAVALPIASASVSGVVTRTTQTFAGNKTFNNNVSVLGGVSAVGFVDLNLTSAGGGGGAVNLYTDWTQTPADDEALSAILGKQLYTGKADKVTLTAGTAGTSSATSGATIAIPYITMNSQGLVTGYGTHNHTLGSAATKTAGTASGNVPTLGAAASTTANTPAVFNASGALIPHASGALGSAAFTASSAYATAAQGTKADNALPASDFTTANVQSKLGNYITTFGTKTGAITLRTGSTTRGAVNFSMSNNELQGTVYLADWAKAANKPSYNFSEIGSKPTTIAGYGITDLSLEVTTVAATSAIEFELGVGNDSVTVGSIPDSYINELS